MLKIFPAILFVIFLIAADEPKKPGTDAELLRGTWTMVSVTVDGKGGTEEQVARAKLVVDGDKFTPTFDGKPIPSTFTLDPSANPKTIDITFTEGDNKGLTVKGIYTLKGDTFILCRTLRPKDERPTEFNSESGSMHVFAAWTRASHDPTLIDAAKAIELAEQFIRDNGYTDFEPPDPSKLVGEAIEFEDRSKWIARRRNTLRPRALGSFHRARNDAEGWTVGFEYVNPSNKANGRAVTMDARGGSLRVQHVDLILEFLGPRPDQGKPTRP